MSNPAKTYIIPERFTFDEDTNLKVFLRDSIEQPVVISAKNLRRIESLFVQYLISAALVWRNAGQDFFVTDVASEVGKALTLLGVNDEILCWKVAA